MLELPSGNSDTKLDFQVFIVMYMHFMKTLYLQHNINDAIAVLPKLQTGLDVNVKFTGVSDFEYTEEVKMCPGVFK